MIGISFSTTELTFTNIFIGFQCSFLKEQRCASCSMLKNGLNYISIIIYKQYNVILELPGIPDPNVHNAYQKCQCVNGASRNYQTSIQNDEHTINFKASDS